MLPTPRIVAIETSSRRGSVAIAVGPDLIATAEFTADLRHAVELLPSIDRLCRNAGWPPASIEQVHVSIGPGSFTGLRVAVTAARHLALAVGARIVAVPSLAVIAENACLQPRVAVILDAKRRQVYAGLFERRGQGHVALGPPVLAEPGPWLAAIPRPLAVIGEGIAYHRAAIDAAGVFVIEEKLWLPRAESVHRLGWQLASAGRFTPAGELVPLYLRRPEAEEIWEQRHANP
jgi:tRNA threonylcarbamoyladenosine biosynthesis protein TsaB